MDTRNALLDAAESAARRGGHDGFSYKDLSAAVGIRTASIHYHFPTKPDLLQAVMQRYHLAMQQALEALTLASTTAGQQLAGIIDLYRQALDQGNTYCLCVALSLGSARLPESIVAQLDAFRAMVHDWLSSVFARGREDGSLRAVSEPALEADACLALLEGAQLAARSSGGATGAVIEGGTVIEGGAVTRADARFLRAVTLLSRRIVEHGYANTET
ncbi:TetR/AcrR family transcriptional regulator [Cobetia crustatorum]|uniref:TetR/AcrR family transcriptional regulator n=1 Tax=Cobetia crustatorum TaxID=553385 RepID=A0A558HQ98_9GAMM|nr:TetR/AcrR family transcriptional regulator [Cobetia crustatorum]TVU71306.1 TetR/AcrR family transcriptional regulator [Cobetia crustatorum]